MTNLKICRKCNEPKFTSDFYKHKSTKDGLASYCKTCTRDVYRKWKQDNPERFKELQSNWKEQNPDRVKELRRNYYENNREREREDLRRWQAENRGKTAEYSKAYKKRKGRTIPEQAWERCKTYFDHACAYCGLSEEEHIEKINQQLHKEHVENDGSNGIDNCVPACKSCNASKGKKDFMEWYSKTPHFNKTRIDKINRWMTKDYSTVIGE